MKTGYVVVLLPQNAQEIKDKSFYMFAKRTNNLEIMNKYLEDRKAKYEPKGWKVALVHYQTALRMKRTIHEFNDPFWRRRSEERHEKLKRKRISVWGK